MVRLEEGGGEDRQYGSAQSKTAAQSDSMANPITNRMPAIRLLNKNTCETPWNMLTKCWCQQTYYQPLKPVAVVKPVPVIRCYVGQQRRNWPIRPPKWLRQRCRQCSHFPGFKISAIQAVTITETILPKTMQAHSTGVAIRKVGSAAPPDSRYNRITLSAMISGHGCSTR